MLHAHLHDFNDNKSALLIESANFSAVGSIKEGGTNLIITLLISTEETEV